MKFNEKLIRPHLWPTLILFLGEKSLARINCLLACLPVCPHFTDWSKNNVKTKGIIFHKTCPKGNQGRGLRICDQFFKILFAIDFFTQRIVFLRNFFFPSSLTKGNWGRIVQIWGQFFEIVSVNSLLIVQK
jgi:hypothetical protein